MLKSLIWKDMEGGGGIIIDGIKSLRQHCSIPASLSFSFPIQYRHRLCLYFIDLLHIYFTLALLLRQHHDQFLDTRLY